MIIQISTVRTMVTLNAVFFICFSILNPAERIRYTTHTLMPLKAQATYSSDRNVSKNSDMAKIIANDGIQIPNVAIIEPINCDFSHSLALQLIILF